MNVILIRTLTSCTLLVLAVAGCGSVRAERFFSYVNDKGLTVYTATRPDSPVAGKVTVHEIQRETHIQPEAVVSDQTRYNRYDDIIKKYTDLYGLDFNLVKAVIMVESNFNAKARSPKGAMGLMQLIPATAYRFGVVKPFDPEENIRGGTRYLRFLVDMFKGDLKLVLSGYNAGENLVKRLGRVPDIQETRNYVRRIIDIYGRNQTTVPDSPTDDTFVVNTPAQRFYKYYDENGVLTLTNLDPPEGALILEK